MGRNFKELKIWQEAHKLTLEVYEITKGFPSEEKFGLIQQIRRASSSIGANIAEGCGQNTSTATKRFLFISYSSLKELDYHLLLAKDLRYLPKEKYDALFNNVENLSRMMYSFISKMPDKTKYI